MQNKLHIRYIINTEAQRGFTLIELLVVLIILGIMAVTVLPKFFGSTGYQEYTYQSEVITKLRSIQIRAMQQTNTSQCHTILVTAAALGIPKNCDLSLSNGWQSDTTSVIIQPEHSVIFNEFSFSFDGMGRPSCNPCSVLVKGESDSLLSIIIESEGYIHGN